jgi:hypothetical protein
MNFEFEAPEDLADDLRQLGIAERKVRQFRDVVEVVVTITGFAGGLVTLVVQGPHMVRHLARSIVSWRSRPSARDQSLRLTATKGRQLVTLELDDEVDIETVTTFLNEVLDR